MEKLKIYNVGSAEIANAVNELIENHNKLSLRVNTLIGLVETDLEHKKGLTKELTENVIPTDKNLENSSYNNRWKRLYIITDGDAIGGESKNE